MRDAVLFDVRRSINNVVRVTIQRFNRKGQHVVRVFRGTIQNYLVLLEFNNRIAKSENRRLDKGEHVIHHCGAQVHVESVAVQVGRASQQ